MLPFWVKRKCKNCGAKVVGEKKTEIKMVTEYKKPHGRIYSKTPFPLKIITTEYTCTQCNSVFSIDDMLGKVSKPWYVEA
jgi:DNA-directed RNA polymerase subunit RPC12/RpoP